MWWKNILDNILRLLGIKNSMTNDIQQGKNEGYTRKYKDIDGINFGEIFAKRLATIATADSSLVIPADNKRAEIIDGAGQRVWDKISKVASLALGTGGSLIIPYVQNGKIMFDIATQDRLCINEKSGDVITKATVLADMLVLNNVMYYRFVNYSIENNTLFITNKVTTQYGREAVVEQWKGIEDIAIANVDRVPFGYIKSPIDNRDGNDDYGVPITYGCDSIIDEIKECLKQFKDEFKLKEVKVFADDRLFKRDKKGNPIISSNLFYGLKNLSEENNKPFEIFSEDYKDNSFINRLTVLFELLEKAVGTSRGILSKPDASYENKDAVREANRATWAIVTALRKNIEKGFEDFLYACNVLANYYNLTPAGEYTFSFDWDYSLIESSVETWNQMKDLQSMGGMGKAEMRAWVTGEDIDTAQGKVDEIAKKEPQLKDMLGMNNNA